MGLIDRVSARCVLVTHKSLYESRPLLQGVQSCVFSSCYRKHVSLIRITLTELSFQLVWEDEPLAKAVIKEWRYAFYNWKAGTYILENLSAPNFTRKLRVLLKTSKGVVGLDSRFGLGMSENRYNILLFDNIDGLVFFQIFLVLILSRCSLLQEGTTAVFPTLRTSHTLL